jgi:hypothetical protein
VRERIANINSAVSIPAQWPLKIRLVSPDAEVFRGAQLVVAADCAAFHDPNFHANYRSGSPVIIGCPKFEDAAMYAAKLDEIFARAAVAGCTVVRMSVPCCGGLARAVEAAAERHGVAVNVKIINI